ncbi:MAG: 16S rRNA (uracil(1498)-N(3))-methyltransferase [Legionellaceae bacterium]|nr:16S rRNA (uracil(1498)-N(3))-methyltransferase [Legionellaceae bacterium]
MRLIRIYQSGNHLPGQIISLSESASQHVGRVLRMRPGDSLNLFDGTNHEYPSTISAINKREVMVEINQKNFVSRESNIQVNLAQAISKGDKMELVVQKAVELGVTTINPLITKRCGINLDEKRISKKQHQWQSIAIAACEQSGRNQVPIIEKPLLLSEYLTICQAENKFVLYPKACKTWREYKGINKNIALLIGPEGGLDEEEITQAEKHNFQPLSLGPRVLRTETAAITAISILQAVYGDL